MLDSVLRLLHIGSVSLMLFAWSLLQPCTAQSKPPDDLPSKLGVRVHEYKLAENSFIDAFRRVSGDFKIPMGISWVNTPSAQQKVTLSWSDATAQEIIEAIAQTQPDYGVQISNGIVHVLSNTIVPSQNFLLLEVAHFEVQHETIDFASRRLYELVKLTVSSSETRSLSLWNGLKRGGESRRAQARPSVL
jgi:hypothetical protein